MHETAVVNDARPRTTKMLGPLLPLVFAALDHSRYILHFVQLSDWYGSL